MSSKKLLFTSFLDAAGVLIYVTLVSLILINGEKIFGAMRNFWSPIAFLLYSFYQPPLSAL